MLTKNVAVQVKATGPADDAELQEGQFTALASVFNNVDAVGDMVMPGAFADDLKAWQDSGDTIPVYWGHRMDDPAMNIGSVLDARETDTGLLVKAQLDLDNPTAAQVYKLLKGRRVGRMSFAYDVIDGGMATQDGTDVYELRKLKLHEVSVVQIPANPAAVVGSVKTFNGGTLTTNGGDVIGSYTLSGLVPPQVGTGHTSRGRKSVRLKAPTDDVQLAGLIGQADQAIDDASAALEQADAAMDALMAYLGMTDLPDVDEPDADDAAKASRSSTKAGRTISAKNEKSLRDALAKFSAGVTDVKSVLAALDSTTTEDGNDGKASPAQPATTEEPDGAKVSEPARPSPASIRLYADLAALAADVEINE